jgi:3-keto-disaccharide hydrolase
MMPQFLGRLVVATVVLLGTLPATVAQEVEDAAKRESVEEPAGELFNGKDLSGWVVEGTAAGDDGKPVWTAQDGMIVCAGRGFGFLRYDRPFGDFTLSLEFRLARGANSGVGIRHGKFTGVRRSRPSFAGYEIQLVDDTDQEPSKTSSGSLYRYVAPKTSAIKPAGEWNRLKITCRGPHIAIELNGKVIHDLDQSSIAEIAEKPLKGYVSLQNHGGQVAFRKIRAIFQDAKPSD